MNDKQVSPASLAGAGEMWSVDADASLQSIVDREDTPPLLRETLSGTLSWQIRNIRPVRTALVSPGVAPQWVAALLALGATVTLEGVESADDSSDGPAEVSLESLLQHQTKGRVSALHVRETGGKLPSVSGGVKWGESHVARTPTDEPIVAGVAAVQIDGGTVRQARVALTGVWSEPARLAEAPAQLVGGPLDEERIQAVAEAVEGEVTPEGDFLGGEEYRRAMAGVMTRRALEACLRPEVGDE